MRGGWIRRATVAALPVLVALLAGIGSAQTVPFSAPEGAVVKVGDRAAAFSLAAGDGRTYALTSVQGKRAVVLVVFRGTW